MNAAEIIGTDWRSVRTVADLRKRISAGADALASEGRPELAADWRKRLTRMPRRMGKEAINVVLFSAYREVGVSVDASNKAEHAGRADPAGGLADLDG